MTTKTRPQQPNHSEGADPPTKTSIRVMILDDDTVDFQTMRRCLESIAGLNAETVGCGDVESAVALVEQSQFDLLFVDYHLTTTTGLAALGQLRTKGCTAPAILLTARHGEGVLHEALRAGVMDYISKDRLDPDLVSQTIRGVLAKAELTQRIQRKQEELEATVECLRRRSEEIERFYHNVSHELKTPLTGAREFVSLVQDETAGPLSESQSDILAAAMRNCDRIAHCVNDMLDTARIETGKLVLSATPHDLVSVLQDALESVRTSAVAKEIEIEVRGMDHALTKSIDPHRMYQVIANLLSNAIKFTPKSGKIELVVEEGDDGSARVRVGDSGPGISSGDESRVFDRLYQSHEDDSAVLGGLGMGLYIAKQIVVLHGGELTSGRSALGGAEFTIELP